ncbi:acyl-protein thioesterase 1-like [Varroa jacobsoni]|nr:acyl-protein thioesterase 1-like [Varroa jacobsoni]
MPLSLLLLRGSPLGASGSVLFRQERWMGILESKMASRPVVIPASARHSATLIFLHGLGDTGYGWSNQLSRICPPYYKVICPHAPTIPVTLNSGMRIPAWFNILSLEASGPQDEEGIRAATVNIQKMIKDEENAGISSDRIMLGGFSMGGALALYAGCTYEKKLGGIIGLSTWLPMPDEVTKAVAVNKETHIYLGHGNSDDLVPVKWGDMTAKHLKKFNPNVAFITYNGMGHSSCPEELYDVANFLKERLPAQ